MPSASQKNTQSKHVMTEQRRLPKLGIIAGGGELPERIVAACREKQREVFVVVIEGEGQLQAFGDVPSREFPIGSVGKIIKALKAENVQDVVLAGRIKRPSFSALHMDMEGVKLMTRIMKCSLKGDNALLSTVMKFLEDAGFQPVGADTILEDIVATEGAVGALSPKDKVAWDDIALGVKVVQTLGTLDIGQAVVVQQGVVLGIEAIEGTDKLLQRVGGYSLKGTGGVLVKLKKPGQEQRVDLPAMGVSTVENAHKAGLRGIAVEVGGALIINRKAVAETADALGLFVVGIHPDTV